jgi:hypothetical protein
MRAKSPDNLGVTLLIAHGKAKAATPAMENRFVTH